jgi:hypothetical protein
MMVLVSERWNARNLNKCSTQAPHTQPTPRLAPSLNAATAVEQNASRYETLENASQTSVTNKDRGHVKSSQRKHERTMPSPSASTAARHCRNDEETSHTYAHTDAGMDTVCNGCRRLPRLVVAAAAVNTIHKACLQRSQRNELDVFTALQYSVERWSGLHLQ